MLRSSRHREKVKDELSIQSKKRKRVSSSGSEKPVLKVQIQKLEVKEERCDADNNSDEYYEDYENYEEFDASKYQLSELELLRRENMKKNEEKFLEFNITQIKQDVSLSKRQQKLDVVGAESPADRKKRKQEELANQPRRMSLRLRKQVSDGASLPQNWSDQHISNYEVRDDGRKPDEMAMDVVNKVDTEITKNSIKSWADLCSKNCSQTEKTHDRNCNPSFDDYEKQISCMKVYKIGKVTKTRIFSSAIHPMEDKTLVSAGDKWGMVGIWDVGSSEDGNSEVFWFQPHSRPINCLKFSPFDNSKLYSCSYDGSVRYADLQKQMFYQLYGFDEDVNKRFNYFAWPKSNPNILYAATSYGDLLLIDNKTGNVEQSFPLYQKSMRCIDIHPVNHNIIAATCYDGTVGTWDVRKLHSNKMNKALSTSSASRTNTTCFFSPITGNKLLLTSQDNYLRVFDVNENGHISTQAQYQIRHDNQTGRWLTTFRACWDPKTDNSFLCGSMNRPRQEKGTSQNVDVKNQLDFYIVGSDKKYSHVPLTHEDFATVSSVNAFHPTKNIIAGGNASGKMYIWM